MFGERKRVALVSESEAALSSSVDAVKYEVAGETKERGAYSRPLTSLCGLACNQALLTLRKRWRQENEGNPGV